MGVSPASKTLKDRGHIFSASPRGRFKGFQGIEDIVIPRDRSLGMLSRSVPAGAHHTSLPSTLSIYQRRKVPMTVELARRAGEALANVTATIQPTKGHNPWLSGQPTTSPKPCRSPSNP